MTLTKESRDSRLEISKRLTDRVKKHLAAADCSDDLGNVETVDEMYETLIFVHHHVIHLETETDVGFSS